MRKMTTVQEDYYLREKIGVERNIEFLQFTQSVIDREMPRLVNEYWPEKSLRTICDIYDNLFPLERLVEEFLEQTE